MAHEPAVIELHHSSTEGVGVLVADDFGPWRSEVRSFLQRKTKCRIVFEACDGLEAVLKTVELRPEVVLLDFCMPGLNGIEAAKEIRDFAPHSKIIVLALEADADLRNAALEAGALACVRKDEMTTALIPAIEAALHTDNSLIS